MLQFVRIFLITGCLSAISLSAIAPATNAQLFNSVVDRLPATERVKLNNGQPVVTGNNGKYIARVLISTSTDTVWSVLTDYRNTPSFMPHIELSKVISSSGNQKTIEQVDSRKVFLVTTRSRIVSAITETPKSRIDFRAIDGDIKGLKGYWLVEPIAPYKGAKANKVLLTQVVETQPKSGIPSGIFYNIFKNSLGEILTAIMKESERRTG